MYYSHSLEERKLDFFITFLGHLIGGNSEYKNLVYPIIRDSHELATGGKNVYTIDRNSYPVIVHLVNRDSNFFKEINPDELSSEDYTKIFSLASQQRDLDILQ